MSRNNVARFRPSAVFPFILSAVSFTLILTLVLSGTSPDLIPDGYLLSFNTTAVGSDLIRFSPITTTASVARSIEDVPAGQLLKERILEPIRSKLMSGESSLTAGSLASTSPTINPLIATRADTNASSAAPVLAIPDTTGPTNPAAIPIALIGTFFQLILNTFASGVGDTLQTIVKGLVAAQKQSFGVDQFYTVHLTGICQGSILNSNATNLTTPLNTTRCISYSGIGAFVANITMNVSSSALVGATNITLPALNKVPGVGKSANSLIDMISAIVLTIFVIVLIGNGISIILSAAAFMLPSYGRIHTAGAAITTLSTQLVQQAAIMSTIIAISMSGSINGFSDAFGLSATVGGKFLGLIWGGYITAQMANGYWVSTWFIEFRSVSYKARRRTAQQMGDYKGIKQEVWSDLRVTEGGWEDTERLTAGPTEIRHWNDDSKM